MKSYKKDILLLVFFGAFFAVACSREQLEVLTSSPEIAFGASTMWQNGPATRTEYSGRDQANAIISETSSVERIYWVQNKDRIRIYSPKAQKLDGTHIEDYYISSVPQMSTDPDNRKSLAQIKCTEQNGLQWNGSGTHHFYALYPAPETEAKYNFSSLKYMPDPDASPTPDVYAKIGAMTGTGNENKAQVTAIVPDVQEVYWNSAQNEYEPNMNYAYMYAATTSSPGSNVELSFKPLVTTIQFTLKMYDGTLTLKEFKLKSSSVDLAGKFTATLNAGDNPVIGTPTQTSKVITLSIPSGQRQTLTTSSAVKITVLALPLTLTNLSVEMTFLNSSNAEVVRTLDLKTRANASSPFTPVTVDAFHKSYINNMGVPGSYDYELTVAGPSAAFATNGGNNNYSITSYKTVAGQSKPVGWTAKFSTDNGQTWSDSKPDWLTGFTTSGAGGTTASAYRATVSANTSTSTRTWQGTKTVGSNNSKANAWDLSNYDIQGNQVSTAGNYNTANCYVVTRPGWYKIPCVYGNAYEGGSTYSVSYSNSNSGTNMLKKFVRHDGSAISNPKFSSNSITVSSAQILWQDPGSILSDASGDANYVYFQITTGNIKQGNAVIAAKNSSGTIVWSWHIWVMEASNMTTTPISSTGVLNPVEVMDLNLGWVDATVLNGPRSVLVKIKQEGNGKEAVFRIWQNGNGTRRQGRSVTYEWGRKDPFPAPPENSYQYSGSDLISIGNINATFDGDHAPSNYAVTLQQTIQNPHKYAQGYWYLKPTYYNLWNADQTWNGDIKVTKTVYDPCPAGFSIPNRNAFNRFFGTSHTIGTYQYGWTFWATDDNNSTVFFPGSGHRNVNGPMVPDPEGYYWTASVTRHAGRPNDLFFSPYYLTVSSNSVNETSAGPPSFGFSVRCIRETKKN